MDIAQHLTERGVRPTALRCLVYRTLAEARGPRSLRQMEEELVTVERSTIFRALQLLAEHHLVHAIEDGSGALKFEACHGLHRCTMADQHPHFYCLRCHRTTCLTALPLPPVELGGGYRIHSVNYVIKGLCPTCAYEEENSSAHRRGD